jgi:hypothetical protein
MVVTNEGNAMNNPTTHQFAPEQLAVENALFESGSAQERLIRILAHARKIAAEVPAELKRVADPWLDSGHGDDERYLPARAQIISAPGDVEEGSHE